VEQWLSIGGRHIDTADDYGSQPDVGLALSNSKVPREDIFVTTKVPGPIGRQAVIDKITKTALPELGLEYIDLVLIHFPCDNGTPRDICDNEHEEERLETWQGLMDLKKSGLIRAAGVSNWNEKHVSNIIGLGQPAVNQVEWHLGYHNETFLSAMKAMQVTVMAWAPLSGPTSQSSFIGHPGISLSDPNLKAVAARYNRSTAEVALRWSTQKGIVPVTASCKEAHLVSDLKSFEFTLTDDDVHVLDDMEVKGSFII